MSSAGLLGTLADAGAEVDQMHVVRKYGRGSGDARVIRLPGALPPIKTRHIMPAAFLEPGDNVIAGALVKPQAVRITVFAAEFLPYFDPAGVKIVSDAPAFVVRGSTVAQALHPARAGCRVKGTAWR